MVCLAWISLSYSLADRYTNLDIEVIMRDIPEGAPPTVVQMFNEGFSEFAEKEDSDATAELKRPPFAMRSQSLSGSRNSGVKTRSDARAEREES